MASAKLSPRLESYMDELVKAGRYGSRSEVLREGLRLVEEREKRLMALDEAIARGLADAAAGRVRPIEETAARLTAKYQRAAEDRGA